MTGFLHLLIKFSKKDCIWISRSKFYLRCVLSFFASVMMCSDLRVCGGRGLSGT